MKKILTFLWILYSFIAEVIGTVMIVMFLLSVFSAPGAKFEVKKDGWSRCFGDCLVKKEEINK